MPNYFSLNGQILQENAQLSEDARIIKRDAT
jgi:hypothetical protein